MKYYLISFVLLIFLILRGIYSLFQVHWALGLGVIVVMIISFTAGSRQLLFGRTFEIFSEEDFEEEFREE